MPHIRNLEPEIRALFNKGYTWIETAKALDCCISTICYQLSKKIRHKSKLRNKKNFKKNPIKRKINKFHNNNSLKKKKKVKHINKVNIAAMLHNRSKEFSIVRRIGYGVSKKRKHLPANFNSDDLLKKFGTMPKCYLTGMSVDLNESNTYSLDHIVPRSRGGTNYLENCGLACKEVNLMKHDKTVDELLSLCEEVLTHHGYVVTKADSNKPN